MPTGHKKEDHIVKIQVEAKNPPRRRARPRARVKIKKITVTQPAIPKALIDNFVGLQRVQANLVEKLDALTKQIAELLRLFESTAKTFAENPAVLTSERDKEFLSKINQLLEQDRAIAKGVIFIEERLTDIEKSMPLPHHEEAIAGQMRSEYEQSQVPKPLPKA
jgi:hypothetical protein